MPGLPEIPSPLSLFLLLTSHLQRCDQVRRLRRQPPQRPRPSISLPSNRRSSWRKRAVPRRRPMSKVEFTIRSPASWLNGSSCAVTTLTLTFPAMRLSSPPIRAGRASCFCAAAPKRRCGRSRRIRARLSAFLPTSRHTPPRAASRWRVLFFGRRSHRRTGAHQHSVAQGRILCRSRDAGAADVRRPHHPGRRQGPHGCALRRRGRGSRPASG